MGYKVIDWQTNTVVKNPKSIPEHDRFYEFDSPEEALLELIVSKISLRFADSTYLKIKKIIQPIIYSGVELSIYFSWRKYIFIEMGNIFSYVGQMSETEKIILKPNLKNIQWNLYDFEERKKHFEAIYKSFDINDDGNLTETNENKSIAIKSTAVKSIINAAPTIHIYLLYCDDTPNIFYVGKSINVTSRFKNHQANTDGTISAPKREWVEFIKKNNYELKYKILETENYLNGITEQSFIDQYRSVKENVVLNFNNPTPYLSSNEIFLYRFNAMLYRKRVVIVDNYEDVAQININKVSQSILSLG